jgi:histidine triad (HIT) family protein
MAPSDASGDCVFCRIVAGVAPASIVFQEELILAFVDLRQFNAGHTLVIPRRHVLDVRDLDDATGAALMRAVTRVSRAVSAAFPNDGLSIWHSAGPSAFQEVPHLHVHVHPRLPDDRLFKLYPTAPANPERAVLDRYASDIRARL